MPYHLATAPYSIITDLPTDDSNGNRTRVTAVKGRCLNRLTMEPDERLHVALTNDIIPYLAAFGKGKNNMTGYFFILEYAIILIMSQKRTAWRIAKMLHTFIKHMEENGWQVALYENRNDYLSNIITARYTNIPEQWLEFIKTVKCMMNAEETVWFLCANDFEPQCDDAFQWNEWEKISLTSAAGDTEWEARIKAFWENHLPIIMSVKGCYSYYAISMKDGSVVRGAEPEFEECEVIAPSFIAFTEKLSKGELQL